MGTGLAHMGAPLVLTDEEAGRRDWAWEREGPKVLMAPKVWSRAKGCFVLRILPPTR